MASIGKISTPKLNVTATPPPTTLGEDGVLREALHEVHNLNNDSLSLTAKHFGSNYFLKSSNEYDIIKQLDVADYNADIKFSIDSGYYGTDDNKSENNYDYSGTSLENNKFKFGASVNTKLVGEAEDTLKRDSIAYRLNFDLPNWGVEDYINERSKWVKGIRSVGDEPGYFYFKVFFKFKTNYGLFGGVLAENQNNLFSTNSALRYLNSIKGKFNGTMLYKQEQIPLRINALVKFVSGLSKINSEYPWLIKGVTGLEKAMNTYIEKFDEEKFIELQFSTESTDMKIINLLNLYKYACYDDINCKEIIPANLRKFDMMLVFYHVPVKYFQTAIMVAPKKNLSTGIMSNLGDNWVKAENIINKTFNFLTAKSSYYKYKRMQPDSSSGYSNMMSFHMFTFNNCEFDVSSFGKYFETEIKNEQAFQFANTSLKIKYDRVYYHQMNEWNQMFFGSDGFQYDANLLSNTELDYEDIIRGDSENDQFKKRLQSIKQARDGAYFFDKNALQYKSLIDYSESLINDGLMSMDMKNYYSFIDGNIYGKYGKIDSEYYNDKLSVLKTGNIRGNIYEKKLTMFGSDKDRKNTEYYNIKLKSLKDGTVSGNLYHKNLTVTGSQFNRTNTEYLNTKLKWLKDGIVNPSGIRKIEVENDELKISGNLINAFESIQEKNERKVNTLDLKGLREMEKITADPFVRDPIKTKKKEIWNYALTGSSKSSSIGGVLDAAQNIANFWKW